MINRIVSYIVHIVSCFLIVWMNMLGSQKDGVLGSPGWFSQEELTEQVLQAQYLERLAHLCIMTKR